MAAFGLGEDWHSLFETCVAVDSACIGVTADVVVLAVGLSIH